MNYFDLYLSYPDHTITAAWDSQVKEAAQTPGLAEILLRRGTELFPRFAACYAELRALPRSARRTLQRQIASSGELAAIFPEWLQSGGGRALRHKLARSLAGAALLLALSQGIATAATITVAPKVAPGIVADGQCSLIEAIVNANNDVMTHADCPAGSGEDTIVLPAKANLRLRDVNDNTYGPTGLPLITTPITIQGNGAKISRRKSAPQFRLLAVSSSGDLTIQNVNLSGGSAPDRGGGVTNYGNLTLTNSSISGNTAGRGGGVSNHGGTLTVENSSISGNDGFWSGGGLSNASAIASLKAVKRGPYCYTYYYYGSPYEFCYYRYFYSRSVTTIGSITITNSTILKNSASSGGGISNYSGTVTIENSTISGNKSIWGAGAFNFGGSFDYYGNYIPAGDLSIANSTISKNSAYRGGGAYNQGTLTIENSTITGNKASKRAGGIFNYTGHNDYYGHYVPGGDLSLVDSTISKNRARDAGGGLVNYGSLAMSNSVISDNKAPAGADVFP